MRYQPRKKHMLHEKIGSARTPNPHENMQVILSSVRANI
jgi:hypothetical protein